MWAVNRPTIDWQGTTSDRRRFGARERNRNPRCLDPRPSNHAAQLTIENNEPDGQFEIRYDGHVSLLAYARRGKTIMYMHTEVPPELEGHGIAGRLAQHALESAREQGLSVIPLCPYVRGYIERNPEYADLVAPPRA